MFSKFVGVLRSFGGRVLVGVDKNGNSFYRKPERVDGALVEKRWVEFNLNVPDPTAVPVEWTSWLSGTRREAPSPQEILDLEAQRNHIKLQASLLQKEEDVRRLKAKLSQSGQKADDASPDDMEIMMQQISGGTNSGQTKVVDSSHTRYTKVRDVKESAEPSTWQPPGRSSRGLKDISGTSTPSGDSSADGSSEPQGQADKFEPGTWRP